MMKFKIILFLFLSLFSGQTLYSQGFAANIGYDYIGRNAGFAGLEYRINSSDTFATNAGIGSFVTSIDKKLTIIPEAHLTKGFGFLTGKMSVSTKHLAPSIGFGFLNAMDFSFGYTIPYEKNNGLNEGIYFGVHFFIGEKKFYDSWLTSPR